MKIGILTLHSGANYGGTLQCTALYNVLKNKGHNVEVINFVPIIIAPLWKRILLNISTVRNIKYLLSFFDKIFLRRNIKYVQNINRNLISEFDHFRSENIIFSSSVNENTIALLNDKYDIIVVGSDQVWGSFVRSHLTYIGDWAPCFNGKFIAYAACAISLDYPLLRKRKITNLLNRFNKITVRDNTTKQLVEHLLKKETDIVADPTLLYSFSKFVTTPIISEPYILIYILGREIKGGNKEVIDFIKNKIGASKTIAVTTYNEDIQYADVTIKNARPDNWVNLIAHSSCVYTDSFHGVLFSLKFKKFFVAYYTEQNRASRLIDLAERFDCKTNIINAITDLSTVILDNPIDRLGLIDELVEKSQAKLNETLI